VIIGEDEIANSTAVLKNLVDGTQESLPVESLVSVLLDRIQ
jgi:histidyl-tRNA synthetase